MRYDYSSVEFKRGKDKIIIQFHGRAFFTEIEKGSSPAEVAEKLRGLADEVETGDDEQDS